MDTITILRDLWRKRLFVVGVGLLALVAGISVSFKVSFPPELASRKYDVGVATTRILVDTPHSQVVEVAPKGSDSLGVRANLLASLMVDGVVKAAIAERAGVPPNKVIGITDAVAEPAPAPTKPTPRDFVLTTHAVTNTGGDQLPIIEVDAQAPNVADAGKLAAAAVAGLRDYLDSKAALQAVPGADRLQVTGLGAPQAATVVRGPSSLLAATATIFIFVLGCACIMLLLSLTRGLRAAAAREAMGDGEFAEAALSRRRASGPAEFAGGGVQTMRARPALVVSPWASEGPSAKRDRARQPDSWLSAPRPSLVVSPPVGDRGDKPKAETASGTSRATHYDVVRPTACRALSRRRPPPPTPPTPQGELAVKR